MWLHPTKCVTRSEGDNEAEKIEEISATEAAVTELIEEKEEQLIPKINAIQYRISFFYSVFGFSKEIGR